MSDQVEIRKSQLAPTFTVEINYTADIWEFLPCLLHSVLTRGARISGQKEIRKSQICSYVYGRKQP